MSFSNQLIQNIRQLGHPLCVGLDPHLDKIPGLFRSPGMDRDAQVAADCVERFLMAVLDRLVGRVAVIKPQSAFFEQLGWRGVHVLERLIKHARAQKFLVILDAKRGDIGSTAAAYARSFYGSEAGCQADALTVNPYMGVDTLEPFIAAAQESESGIFVLVKTSNPGSGDFQDLNIDGIPLFQKVAQALQPIEQCLCAADAQWSSLGVVVGATYPDQALAVRELLPRSLFLIPGFGAQGGAAKDAVASFVKGPNGREGGIVNSSRGIVFPKVNSDCSLSIWEAAIDAGLDQAIDALACAIHA